MKKTTTRLICGAGALLFLACGALALASGDSLITLSYLTDTVLPGTMSQAEDVNEELLNQSYKEAGDELEKVQKDLLSQLTGDKEAVLTSPDLRPRDWSDGDEVELTTGSGLLLMAGTADVVHNGVFIDVTEGAEVASGTRLTAGHRYLVGEDTRALVLILSGAAQMGVQGVYNPNDGKVVATPFYDVCRTDWYYEPVNFVYRMELFSGMDAHHFCPGEAMNRAMLMTVLYRMAGTPEKELAAAGGQFADVPDSAWYAPYVKWGAAQGITAGTGPDTFSPEQQVTRQQVVTLLYSFGANYLGLELTDRADLSGYQDLDQVDSWARDAFSWAVSQGVVSSTSVDDLILSPQKDANRAEVAAMLRTFAEKLS